MTRPSPPRWENPLNTNRRPATQQKETMKKIVTVTEVEGEGLEGLLGQRVTLFCLNYIYTGTLEGVNDKCVKLADAAIVYETGSFSDHEWKDAQSLPNAVYVMMNVIESFTILKAGK